MQAYTLLGTIDQSSILWATQYAAPHNHDLLLFDSWLGLKRSILHALMQRPCAHFDPIFS